MEGTISKFLTNWYDKEILLFLAYTNTYTYIHAYMLILCLPYTLIPCVHLHKTLCHSKTKTNLIYLLYFVCFHFIDFYCVCCSSSRLLSPAGPKPAGL